MTADFNWFLNKQGPRGQQGVKGEQGFSPVITVAEDTAKAYILRIQTQDDTFLTPNLRGTVEDLGGTYVRYNPETGQVYAGSPDVATTETYGVIRLATQQDVTDLAQDAAVTPELLANQIGALDLSNDYVTINTPQNINASKTFTSGISLSSIHNSDGAEVLNFVSGEPFKFKTLNNGLNVEGGTLRVTDGSIKSKSTKQPSTDNNVYDVVTSFDLATTENAGIVKPDNSTVFIDKNGVISAKSGAIDDSNTSTQSTWSSSKIDSEITTVAQEVVNVQGDVASLNTDVNTLKPIVESHTTSIGSINDSLATAMSDITKLKEGKQDKLTAGNNITIEGNVISATGGAGGSGLEICDISMALYVDETKGLRRYLNGQIVDINTNTQAFLNRLLQIQTTNPDYFTTEDNWQAEALLNIDGCVYKFVLNYSGADVVSVRLPKYPDYVEINAGGTLPVVGNGMVIGLTNGSALYGMNSENANDQAALGMSTGLYGKKIGASKSGSILKTEVGLGLTTDPAKSGIQTTLKQTKLKMRYFIQIATGSETEANIVNTLENVNGFTLLESKYSDKPLYNESWLLSNGQWNAKAVYPTVYEGLQVEYNTEIEAGTTVTLPSGVSYTKRGLSVKSSTETYTDYDLVLNTAEETFRLPLKTKLASGKAIVGNGMTLGLTNGTQTGGLAGYSNGSTNANIAYKDTYGVTVGNTTTGTSITGSLGVTTDPTKSGIETSDSGLYLYYYVGDIDQNHGIVNMGRIGEQLANKQDKLIRYPIEVSDKSLMPSWYVVYNDGWCEQGGRLTSKGKKTLLKNYADTNYGVHLTYNGGTNWGNPPYINNVTTSGFNFDTTSSGVSASAYINWSAAGRT